MRFNMLHKKLRSAQPPVRRALGMRPARPRPALRAGPGFPGAAPAPPAAFARIPAYRAAASYKDNRAAKTKEAAGVLSEQFRNKTAGKIYYAIVQGHPEHVEGTLEDLLYFDRESNTSYVVTEEDPRRKDAKPAKLNYRVVEQGSDEASQVMGALSWSAEPDQTLVRVQLLTGRHHQIRVQMAHMGTPLVGDRRYGSAVPEDEQLRLCSWQLEIRHPKTGKTMCFCWDQT